MHQDLGTVGDAASFDCRHLPDGLCAAAILAVDAIGAEHVDPGFHSECDVAALVYGQKDDPDILLRTFARRLIEEGFDVKQRNGVDVGSPSPVKFVLLPDEERRERPYEVPDGVDLCNPFGRRRGEAGVRASAATGSSRPQSLRVDGSRRRRVARCIVRRDRNRETPS
jgi:hypothetical protein